MSNETRSEKSGKLVYVFPAASFIAAVLFVSYAVTGVSAQLGPLLGSRNAYQMAEAEMARDVQVASIEMFRCQGPGGPSRPQLTPCQTMAKATPQDEEQKTSPS